MLTPASCSGSPRSDLAEGPVTGGLAGPILLSVVTSAAPIDHPGLLQSVLAGVDAQSDQLIEVRRDLHAHPELSWAEERTTSVIAKRLDQVGLVPTLLPRNGLMVDIGSGPGPLVALRADLDALPVEDRTNDPWASTVQGVAHACGHDLHAAALLGAGLALAGIADRLPGRVRLIFQPAEEIMPGGALMAIEAGALDGVSRIFGLHADPAIDVGTVGLREGPLTGAADSLDVLLDGKGGHTSRPHLTEDLTFALGKLVTELPAVLSRRLDPRAGVSVVWGIVRSGSAVNVIPATGRAGGTVRMLDAVAWAEAEALVRDTIEQIVEPYGVEPTVTYVRGVPPVVNEHRSTLLLGKAVETVLGEEANVATSQSLGGEDFAWYLESVPGAMGRLGTRTPGGPTYDLHQGDLRVDERAISVGAKVLATAALKSMARRCSPRRAEVDGHRPITLRGIAARRVGALHRARIGCRPYVPGSGTPRRGGILRRFSKIAAVVVVGAMALSGCGSSSGGGNSKSSASNDVCKTAKSGDGPKVGVAYDVGGRGDQSFNDSAYRGLTKAVEGPGRHLHRGQGHDLRQRHDPR